MQLKAVTETTQSRRRRQVATCVCIAWRVPSCSPGRGQGPGLADSTEQSVVINVRRTTITRRRRYDGMTSWNALNIFITDQPASDHPR